jgi:hypothetical protein
MVSCARNSCAGLGGHERKFCVTTCGGRLGCPLHGPAPIRTLAYVVTECRDGPEGFSVRQALHVRRDDRDLIVAQIPTLGPVVVGPLFGFAGFAGPCEAYGAFRIGVDSVIFGVFHRLGVSPDGSTVVFEVTDDYSIVPSFRGMLPEDQEGIFSVRSDGTDLRRLGPASRAPSFAFPANFGAPHQFRFSPDGRRVVFTDLGPDAEGNVAVQIFTMEVAGRPQRGQVTHIPEGPPGFAFGDRSTGFLFFLDDKRISFATTANVEGQNPGHRGISVLVRLDGTVLYISPSFAQSGGDLIPRFAVRGARGGIAGPVVEERERVVTREVYFWSPGRQVLQLTNFKRLDTGDPVLKPGGHQVFVSAAGDPLHTNPGNGCQLFSVDTLGAHLRQLTYFHLLDRAMGGCVGFVIIGPNVIPLPDECLIDTQGADQDPRTGTLVFSSTCDPVGSNPYGDQLFAMRPDGSGLHQLTQTRGLVRVAPGIVEAELPRPYAYSANRRGP